MTNEEVKRLGPQMGSLGTGLVRVWAPEGFFFPSGQDIKLGNGKSPPTSGKNKTQHSDC